MTKPVIIIGAGLFGSMAAILAKRAGRTVYMVDDARPNRGSAPAACLMKPGWLSGLGPAGTKGLQVLDEVFGLQRIEFDVAPGMKTDVFWVPPRQIFEQGRASCARLFEGKAEITTAGAVSVKDYELRGDVLVAAGVWSNDLLPEAPKIDALAGIAFTFRGECKEPIIRPWAPYKQVVAFTRDKGTTWVGDGSSILQKNWTFARQQECLDRCMKFAEYPARLLYQEFGLRPYVKGRKGLFEQVRRNVWVSSGGAKNGTVLAAYQAACFVEAIR